MSLSIDEKFSTDVVIAAACMATRVNNGYIKIPPARIWDSVNQKYLDAPGVTNKVRIYEALENQSLIEEQDIELATKVRMFCSGLVMKLLLDTKMSDFDKKILEIVNQDETSVADAALIAYAPTMYLRHAAKQEITDLLDNCERSYVEAIGKKITTTVTIVKSIFSKNYNCYFITAVTESNHNVFFSSQKPYEVKQKFNIQGKVKAHRDNNVTQLNYVKICQ
jgi:hypothetical protein